MSAAGRTSAPNTRTALTTTNRKVLFIMASRDAITIPFELPRDEAAALSHLVKRIGYEDCTRFASKFAFYSGRTEADTMWSAVRIVQRQLAEAGFAPR